MGKFAARDDRTGEIDLAHEVAHAVGFALALQKNGEGVDAVDDLGDVLGVVQVDRLEAEDLETRVSSVFPLTAWQ